MNSIYSKINIKKVNMRTTTMYYPPKDIVINIYCLDPMKSIQTILEIPLRSPNGKIILPEGPAEWFNPRSSFFAKNLRELSSAITTLKFFFYPVEYEDFARFEIMSEDSYESLQSLSKGYQMDKIMGASVYHPSNEEFIFSLTRILDKSLNPTSQEQQDVSLEIRKRLQEHLAKWQKIAKQEIRVSGSTTIAPIVDKDGYSDHLDSAITTTYAKKNGLTIRDIFVKKVNSEYLYENTTYTRPELVAKILYEKMGWTVSHCEGASVCLAIGAIVMTVIEENPGYLANSNTDLGIRYASSMSAIMRLFVKPDDPTLSKRASTKHYTEEDIEFFEKIAIVFASKDIQKVMSVAKKIAPQFRLRDYAKPPDTTFVQQILERSDWNDLAKMLSICPNEFDSYSPSGWPDLTLLGKSGQIKFVEVKSQSDKLTPAQKKFLSLNIKRLPCEFEFLQLIEDTP